MAADLFPYAPALFIVLNPRSNRWEHTDVVLKVDLNNNALINLLFMPNNSGNVEIHSSELDA